MKQMPWFCLKIKPTNGREKSHENHIEENLACWRTTKIVTLFSLYSLLNWAIWVSFLLLAVKTSLLIPKACFPRHCPFDFQGKITFILFYPKISSTDNNQHILMAEINYICGTTFEDCIYSSRLFYSILLLSSHCGGSDMCGTMWWITGLSVSGLHLNELIFKQKLRKESVSEEREVDACLLAWCHESLMLWF